MNIKNFCEKCGSIENEILEGFNVCVKCKQKEYPKIADTIQKMHELTKDKSLEELIEAEEKNKKHYIKERKSKDNMSNYYNIIDKINRYIKDLKITKYKLAEGIGISEVRLSQILNKSREANGGELINLMVICQEYIFEPEE